MMHDYDLVVTGDSTGPSMQFTGRFTEQYWETYVPACRDVLELLFSSIPEVQEQAFQTADFIAEPDRRYGARLNETLEYCGCKGILDYDRETRNWAQRDTHGALSTNKEKRERLCSPLIGVTSDSWDTPAGRRVYDACRGFSVPWGSGASIASSVSCCPLPT